MSLLGKIFRAAMYRPWEFEDEDDGDGPEGYVIANEGAPENYEFRMSPDYKRVAIRVVPADKWLIFENVVVLQELRASEPGTLSEWRRFLEVEEVD